MCEECEKWVHSQCANFSVFAHPETAFYCIQCKIPEETNSEVLLKNAKRKARQLTKCQNERKKKNEEDEILNSLGFDWELTANEMSQDIMKVKEYLNAKNLLEISEK